MRDLHDNHTMPQRSPKGAIAVCCIFSARVVGDLGDGLYTVREQPGSAASPSPATLTARILPDRNRSNAAAVRPGTCVLVAGTICDDKPPVVKYVFRPHRSTYND
jgi:hypothetical protein